MQASIGDGPVERIDDAVAKEVIEPEVKALPSPEEPAEKIVLIGRTLTGGTPCGVATACIMP